MQAMDLRGFEARSTMPESDIALVEAEEPGFILRRIRLQTARLYAQLRKRYLTPFGQAMGVPTAEGTDPPPVTYTGIPYVGSFELVLSFVVAGAIGVAAFHWSIDGGNTQVSQVDDSVTVTNGGTGYTSAPAVVFGPPDLPWGVQATGTASLTSTSVSSVTVTAQGSGYLFPPSVAFVGGAGAGAAATATLDPLELVTAATVLIPGTGVTAVFPTGTFSTDNVYTSAAPCPEAFLGWLSALVTVDAYQKRGVNPQDPQLVLVVADRDRSLGEVKEAADTKDGLYDLPLNDDAGTATGIAVGGPLGYSEASPYRAFDIERRRGRAADARHFRDDDEREVG
jgi:hypothetical protein